MRISNYDAIDIIHNNTHPIPIDEGVGASYRRSIILGGPATVVVHVRFGRGVPLFNAFAPERQVPCIVYVNHSTIRRRDDQVSRSQSLGPMPGKLI